MIENEYKQPTKEYLLKNIKNGWPNPIIEDSKLDYLITFGNRSDLSYYTFSQRTLDPIIPDIINGMSQKEKILELNSNIKNTEVDLLEHNTNNYILVPRKNLVKYVILKKIYNSALDDIIKYFNSIGLDTLDTLDINAFCNRIVWCLVHRYHKFNLWNGASGSITDSDYEYFYNLGARIECFASFFNKHNNFKYCGLFPDLEFIFGCIGEFFTVKFISGKFIANPPYITDTINKCINKFVKTIEDGYDIDVMLILPAWSISDRIILNKKFNEKLKFDYTDNYILDTLRCSEKYKYFYYDQLILKTKYKFYDYLLDSIVNFTHVNIIGLSNKSGSLKYKLKGDYIRL